MAFNNPIISGGGDLVVPRIQSPNFVHTVSGWQINQDGSAEFQDVIIAGGGGATVTFSATAPGSPSVGDLWYDTANGLIVSQWTGSVWQPYQIGSGAIASGGVGAGNIASGAALSNIGAAGITSTYLANGVALANIGAAGLTSAYLAAGTALANLSAASITASLLAASAALSNIGAGGITASYIATNAIVAGAIAANAVTTGTLAAGAVTAAKIAANTITASQLAAGIVYAGIVNGTLIEGAQFVAYGTTGEILVYSGTPASGNLIMSVSATSGTDSHGNDYYPVVSVGDQSAAHLSIDDSGNLFVANSSNNLVFEIASGDGSVLIYNTSGIGAGNLLVAIAPDANTDGAGNSYAQGLTVYGANGIPVGISMPTGNPDEATNGFVATGVVFPGGDGEYQYIEMVSPRMTGTASDTTFVSCAGAAIGTPGSAYGSISYVDTSAGVHDCAIWGTSGIDIGYCVSLAATQPGTSGTTIAQETWHYVGSAGQPAFGSGWSNVGSPNAKVAFRYLPTGDVQIKGYASNGTAANTAAVFTLPAAYRPASQQLFTVTENPNTAPILTAFIIPTAGTVSRTVAAGAGIYALDMVLNLTI